MMNVQAILESVENRPDFTGITFADDYAEPGYSLPDGSPGIAFANWNDCSRYNPETKSFDVIGRTMPRVATMLEKLGYELEWEDEWTVCSDCGKALRTSGNCYGWTRSYWEWEDGCGDITCEDCLDPKEYLESLEGKTGKAATMFDPSDYGYIALEEGFEHGLHPGQDADPHTIGKSLEGLGITRYLFTIDGVGQFDLSFSVWIHKSEKVDPDKWDNAEKDGPSVSAGMIAALRSASLEMSKLEGEGVRVAICNAHEGTATARMISPQEFAEKGIG